MRFKKECIVSLTNLLAAIINDEITDGMRDNFVEGVKELGEDLWNPQMSKEENFLGDLFMVTNITNHDNASLAEKI